MASEPLNDGVANPRLHMVNGQLRTSDVRDARLLEAFLDTPREAFVAPALARLAYLDQDAPASGPAGRKLLAPRTLGLLLQAAAVEPGERALEVGGGSGYGAAILASMGAKVVALETDSAAARAALKDVDIVEGPLFKGAPSKGPYDVIVINGAIEISPSDLIDQLAPGGRLVAVDVRAGSGRAVIIEKSASGLSERALFDSRADVLPGFERAPAFTF